MTECPDWDSICPQKFFFFGSGSADYSKLDCWWTQALSNWYTVAVVSVADFRRLISMRLQVSTLKWTTYSSIVSVQQSPLLGCSALLLVPLPIFWRFEISERSQMIRSWHRRNQKLAVLHYCLCASSETLKMVICLFGIWYQSWYIISFPLHRSVSSYSLNTKISTYLPSDTCSDTKDFFSKTYKKWPTSCRSLLWNGKGTQ